MPLRFASAWLLGTSALMAVVVLQFNLPNLGNNLLPRNLFAWALLVAATGGLWVYAVRQPQFYWSNGCYFWLIPPSAVMLHSVFMPAAQPHYALLAAGALLVFSLWLVGLVQARLSDQEWYRISQVVLGGAFVLVLLALPTANYLNRPEWLQSLPLVMKLPEGGFQQRNVFASFLGSALIWAWAMRLQAQRQSWTGHLALGVMAFFVAWCIYLSGSRTGSVGVSICVGLLLLAAVWRGWRGAGLWVPLISVIAALALTIYLPIEDINARMADLADGRSTSVRLSMWQVAWHTGLQAPWTGHGLGSFTEAFHPVFVSLAQSGVSLSYVNYLNHPHNETLLWWVEMGLFGWVFVLLPWVVSILYLGLWRNPSALLFCAALGPILLHTQTEFPLHTSGVHWWLAGLIIVSTVRRDLLPQRPMQLKPLWPGVIATFSLVAVITLVHTGWLSYQNWTRAKRPELPLAEHIERRAQDPELNHFILGREATDFWILTLSLIALSQSNAAWVGELLPSLESMQTRWQGPAVWNALAAAYALLDQRQQLVEHLRWVSALQPAEGAKLRAQFQP